MRTLWPLTAGFTTRHSAMTATSIFMALVAEVWPWSKRVPTRSISSRSCLAKHNPLSRSAQRWRTRSSSRKASKRKSSRKLHSSMIDLRRSLTSRGSRLSWRLSTWRVSRSILHRPKTSLRRLWPLLASLWGILKTEYKSRSSWQSARISSLCWNCEVRLKIYRGRPSNSEVISRSTRRI